MSMIAMLLVCILLNIHDVNDMQSHKLGDAMFDEDDIFCPPSFDELIYYDESMPLFMMIIVMTCMLLRIMITMKLVIMIASHDSYFVEFAPTIPNEKNFAYVESNEISMLVDHEKNALGAGYIVEFIHDATENYYEGGIYACRSCNNIKFPLYEIGRAHV